MMKPQTCPRSIRLQESPLFFRGFRAKAGKKGPHQCLAIPSAMLYPIPPYENARLNVKIRGETPSFIAVAPAPISFPRWEQER